MSRASRADGRGGLQARRADGEGARVSSPGPAGTPSVPQTGSASRMTSFVESCVETVAGSAVSVERHSRGRRNRARKLLKVLAGKRNILVTTHEHPDPDAFGSALGLCTLLTQQLPDATVSVSLKGRLGGGINDVFYKETPLKLLPWDESKLGEFDAIILLDTQPAFAYNPLPAGVELTAVIDHHRPGRGRKPACGFCDIRPDVGACTSIVFSYYMELEAPIDPPLAAVMLYAIESDLAGAAGQPNELDNIALSGLMLKADMHKLYRMRYVSLPRSYFVAYATGLNTAVAYDGAVIAHLGAIDSLEKPAVMADFLLRYEPAKWALVSGVHGSGAGATMVLSLRTSDPRLSAGDLMRRLLRGVGEGGGHRTKAGGVVKLTTGTPAEVERVRTVVRKRCLRALKIPSSRGVKLVPST